MTTHTERPQLTTLIELPARINEIVAWTVAHPVDDYVLHFPLPLEVQTDAKYAGGTFKGLKYLPMLRSVDAYIAGSAALHRLLLLIDSTRQLKWKPEDTDVFFLNQEVNNRVPFLPIDVVQCKEKTVEELLLNFDLPICRVAMNFAYDFWVSAQCLAAIHTHRQNIPIYLKDKLTFNATLREHTTAVTKPEAHEYLYNRFTERVKKYQNRGIGVNWIETDTIIPWVRNRFHYATWLLQEDVLLLTQDDQ